MIRLWGRTTSINVRKVLWTLQEAGVCFERIDAGLAFGVVNDADYVAKNPNRLAKLHRKLRKLPSKVAQMVEDLTGETVEQLRDRLRQGSPSDAAAHAKKYAGLGKILDWNPDGSGPNLIPISHHEDSMHAVTTCHGQYEKP